ncbi:MAG: hypothetical protein IT285_02790 [Bdellovibrionales bacterium]|nr:hypothetical protein [Bdellovibrionales bacterium]
MKFRTIRLAAFATAMSMALCVTSAAQAGVWLQGAAALLHLQSDDPAGTSLSANQWLASGTAGYRFSQGFIVGLQGLSLRAAMGSERSLTAWGLKGGFLLKGIEVTGGFLPFAEQELDGVSRDGGGFSVNVAYHHEVTPWLNLGLAVTYWSVQFAEEEGDTLPQKPSFTALAPQLSLGLHF